MEKFKDYAKWFYKSFIWLGLLLLIIDIVTKNVIIANRTYILAQGDHGIDLIPGFLAINYTINNNAAFGLGTTSELANRILYIVFASIACIVLIFVYVKFFKRLGKMYKACIMMILVGALGNLIDRTFFTTSYLGMSGGQPGVVDWIDFYGIWPYIFNIADSAIVIGTILLIVWLIVEEIRDSKKRNAVTLKKDVVEAKIAAQEVKEVEPVEEVKEVEPVEEVKEAEPLPTPVKEEKKEEVKPVKKTSKAPSKSAKTQKNSKK